MITNLLNASVAALHHAAAHGRSYSGIEILYSFLTAVSFLLVTDGFVALVKHFLEKKHVKNAAEIAGYSGVFFLVVMILTVQTIALGDFPWNAY